MKDICPVIHAKAGPPGASLSLIFYFIVREASSSHCSTEISWGRREKSHNPDWSGLLGAVSAPLARQRGCGTACSLLPSRTLLDLYPTQRTVSSERFCLISLSGIQPLQRFMDVSISGISYRGRHTPTNRGNAQSRPQNSQQLPKALPTSMTIQVLSPFYMHPSKPPKGVQGNKSQFSALTTSLLKGNAVRQVQKPPRALHHS